MRRFPIFSLFLLLLLLSACGGRETTLVGTLADGEDLSHVWVVGGVERAEIVEDSFALAGIRGDAVELRFARGEREVGRMELREIPRGAALHLRGVAVDDGVAFPLALEGEQDLTVEINGVRMGTPGTVPGRVDTRASLLSRSRSGDALLVRPHDGRLPDLRVVVTPGTEVQTEDGDPVCLERTDFGDTLRIVGSGEAGFVIATRVEVPRARARSSTSDLPQFDGTPTVGTAASSSGASSSPRPAVESRPSPPERARTPRRGPAEGRGRDERGPPGDRGPPGQRGRSGG